MAKGKFGKIVALGALAGAGAWVYRKYDTIKSMYHKVSLFKGERYEYDTFDGEAIAAMFSGVNIDLSDVEFAEDEVYLDIYALCSGVRVLIPSDVEVVLEGTNNASGVKVDQDEDTEKTKTLYINYNVTASGLLVTDDISEYEGGCCDDDHDDCCDDACCSEEAEDFADETAGFTESVADTFEEVTEETTSFVEEAREEVTEELNETVVEVQETVEEVTETAEEVAEETVEEVTESVEENTYNQFNQVEEQVEYAAEEIGFEKAEDVVEKADELKEAAGEVEEAIKDFVGEDSFDAFEPADDSEDDFFE